MIDALDGEAWTHEVADVSLREGEAFLDCFQYSDSGGWLRLQLILPDSTIAMAPPLAVKVVETKIIRLLSCHENWCRANERMSRAERDGVKPSANDRFQCQHASTGALAELLDLGTLIVRPLMDALRDHGVRRIIISPDGVLHRVPWAALRLAGFDGAVRALIELMEVQSVSSLTRWHDVRGRPPVAVRRMLLAAPFGKADPALPPILEHESGGIRGFRAGPHRADDDEMLAASRWEVTAIADVARSAAGAYHVVVLPAEKDTADDIVQHFPDMQIIHLATHGEHRPHVEVLQQFVIHAANHTVIPVRELLIEQMQMPELLAVILSACELGSGVVRGADVAGFAEAFFHTGARMVLAPIFAIPDSTSAVLMVEWYRRWFAGEGIEAATAWKDTVAWFRTAYPAMDHPFFWGGYLLFGDGGVSISG